MKYFFLSEGWIVGRVWEFGGLWDETSRRRKPYIKRLNLGMVERGQVLWLHEVEEAVIMVEVMPTPDVTNPGPFGKVILSRLLSGEQVVDCLGKADGVVKVHS
ncbi:conserved hypothetical protein [Gloeothece citriformis PCC 7424]|uniref:Uncharacterized protein n=1 Tax=Gloeothece citriformis (strain PCC 7424) TaxID=65393 RepID=B7K6W7_GLOC7|nr:hypothetical protein [Gloeothece citriformis]ACK72666.1 conserved hypothetical protein [Gloeothece citriformis PCC 7424]